MKRAAGHFIALAMAALLAGCASVPSATNAPLHDTVIRGGTVYDGSGGAPFVGDVAIDGDRITDVGTVEGSGRIEIDASGMAVAPGFINMLSWANESLIEDGRGMSDLKQGVTLEVFGEGWSMGPYTQAMKDEAAARQGDIKYPITWTTLGEYLQQLEDKGISPNVASFVGATTVRMHELGEADVDPTPQQLDRMRALVRSAMEEGALGVGSSLIYAPANYAETPELVALVQEAGTCGGMYISHMRSEGDNITAAIDELVTIARQADVPAEIYHLKLAGKDNWNRLPEVIAQIGAARAEGLKITTDMYLYTAGGTFLAAVTPPWAQDGGYDALLTRLRDPAMRAKIIAEMRRPDTEWENLLRLAGGGENVLLVSFSNPDMKALTGKTLAEVAKARGTSVEDTVIDLLLEDGSGIGAAFFLMSEENVRAQTALPYMSFGSDAEAMAPEGPFLLSDPHPRAYGNVARLLGKYVREEQALTLQDAVRKLTSLPAANLSIRDRGALAEGKFADVVIFDPATIGDRATYARPHQYATGMRDVFVNGVQVLANGEHTGAEPGRFVHGPGWTGWPDGGACR